MRTDTIRAAAVQIAPDLTGRAGTIERVLNAIAEAAEKGAEFIVFPETFVPYYPYFSFVLPPVQQGPHIWSCTIRRLSCPRPKPRP
ncbi:nitrilase-related carbon-nitrogen hydrolase [Sulfitobacter porphyrae]|uniref:Nitrilase-related carbon-nitrogen hydrolase n=1 Tax=Sulfitobacter porphyrae TaxID=1246864 RepID=A0ABW2B9U2_9RHOB